LHGDGDDSVDVIAPPFEVGVRRHTYRDEEISRLSAAGSGSALPGDADGPAVRGAFRDPDPDRLGFRDFACSPACRADRAPGPSRSVARRALFLAAERERRG